MNNLKYILIAVTTFAVDMLFKNRAEKWVNLQEREECGAAKSKFFVRRKHHNAGFSMNVASDRQGLVAKLSLLVTVGLIAMFFHTLERPGKAFLKTGAAIQLGGACSNTYDRLMRKYVVDYFSFTKPPWLSKIILNIADVAIFIGGFMVLLDTFTDRKAKA